MKNAILIVLLGALAAGCAVRSETVVERPVPARTATVVATDAPPGPPSTVIVRER
jgi:hypothetical protein